MKLRTEINWWLPFGYSVVYQGSPKTLAMWIFLTWRGYLATWQLLFRVGYLLWKGEIK